MKKQFKGVNKVLSDMIHSFNDRTEYMSEGDMIREAKKEVKNLLKKYKSTTVRGYITLYRKHLKSANVNVIKAFRLNNKEQKKIESSQNKKTAKRHKKLIEIRDIDRMLDIAVKLLDSEKYTLVAAALCLLTGRRVGEIMKTAKFKNSKNSKKVMLFEGQLKTDDKKVYEIFVLRNSKKECKIALKKLRSMVDTKKMSNVEVSKKYTSRINEDVDAWFACYFDTKIGRRSSHDLRNVYATYCNEHFKHKSQTTNSFLSQILGHHEDDIEVSNSYQKYYLK